ALLREVLVLEGARARVGMGHGRENHAIEALVLRTDRIRREPLARRQYRHLRTFFVDLAARDAKLISPKLPDNQLGPGKRVAHDHCGAAAKAVVDRLEDRSEARG